MPLAPRVITYPPLAGLFDSATVKAYSGRRAVYHVLPDWRPTVSGTFFSHQWWAMACTLQHEQFLVLADTGLGKTKIALDTIEYRLNQGLKHALILTGRPIATDEWVVQAGEYIKTPILQIAGTPDERREQIVHYPKAPIIVSDYSTLQTCFTGKQRRGGHTAKGKPRTRMVMDEAALAAFGRQFDIVVLDEIHQLKNPASNRYQMVEVLTYEIPARYGLTGTLFDRHPEEAWAPFWLIDRGETLGNRHDFLAYFFDEVPAPWNRFQTIYRLKKTRREEFKQRLRHRSIRVAKKECKDIPDVQVFPVALVANAEQKRYMKAMEQKVYEARKRDEQEASFMYLRQLVSGLHRIAVETADGGRDSITVRLASSPKLDWLIDFLDTLPEEEQVVVFYEFRASGEWIAEALAEAKVKTTWLYGGMPGDQTALLGQWKARRTRVLLTQTQMAAESLNLQQSAYVVQYETPVTYRVEKQSLARVGGRIGGRPSIAYKLTIRGSVETRIVALIREGRTISEELLETRT